MLREARPTSNTERWSQAEPQGEVRREGWWGAFPGGGFERGRRVGWAERPARTSNVRVRSSTARSRVRGLGPAMGRVRGDQRHRELSRGSERWGAGGPRQVERPGGHRKREGAERLEENLSASKVAVAREAAARVASSAECVVGKETSGELAVMTAAGFGSNFEVA